MQRPDEAVDRVLAGLRDVQAPAGMERRILQAVAERANARTTWGWRPAAAVAVACAAVLAGAMLHSSQLAEAPRPAVAAVQADSTAATIPQPPPEPSARPSKKARHSERSEEPLHFDAANAPSFPAPPLPLTDQERLLIEIARRGKPSAPAALDPELLTQREAASEAKFSAQLAISGELLARGEDVEPKFPKLTEMNLKGEIR